MQDKLKEEEEEERKQAQAGYSTNLPPFVCKRDAEQKIAQVANNKQYFFMTANVAYNMQTAAAYANENFTAPMSLVR